MVPFRLTQNMVDSFGISGVEGSYRKCAEITLQVRVHCFLTAQELAVHPHLALLTIRPLLFAAEPQAVATRMKRTYNHTHMLRPTFTHAQTHTHMYAHTHTQVLRQHRSTLMTSAETFLYDPLVDWMNARKGGQMMHQDMGAEHENPSVS